MKLASATVAAFLFHSPFPAREGSARIGQEDQLHPVIAQAWLEAHGAAEKDLQKLLDSQLAHLELGALDIRIPVETLRDSQALKELGNALLAAVEMQRGLDAWLAGTAEEKRKDDPIAKWLRGLTPKAFGTREARGRSLLDVAEVDSSLRAAFEEYARRQRSGSRFGLEREIPSVRLALFPRREDFVALTCVAGLLDPRLKASAWSADLVTWLEYTAAETRFLSLEYGAEHGTLAKVQGTAVGERNPAALGQLVCQVACRTLLEGLFGERLDPALVSGLANALVIDLHGELDTRIDGDVRSRSSQGSSMFIPGGNPDGGFLPPTSAENRWRGTKGRDHFTGVLAGVQKQSGRKAPTRPERLTRFELQSDDGAKKVVVSAPFLGPKAVRPAREVFPDYLELVRCYGIAFLHWLRVEAAAEASPQKFASFLQTLARAKKGEELPDLLRATYGQPLSASDPEQLFLEPTLEGRFLAWLAR